MDIKCKKTNCLYNDSSHCSAGTINVGSDLDCKTFIKDKSLNKKEAKKVSGSLFEAGSLEANHAKINLKVGCGATNCLFNKNNTCQSNGISVLSGRGRSAFCATNLQK
jgi:hypothetical protein